MPSPRASQGCPGNDSLCRGACPANPARTGYFLANLITELQPGIGDENKIARRIEGEPRRQHVAGPEIQKHRDQRDLLGNPEPQLKKICGPAPDKSSRAARNAHQDFPIVASP